MLYGRKRVAFYCNGRTKNTLNGQNAGFRNVKACSVYSYSNNCCAINDDTTEVYCAKRWSIKENPHSEKWTLSCHISCQSMGLLCAHLRFVCLVVAIIRLKRLRNRPSIFLCSESIFFHVVLCWLDEENMGREDCFLQCLYMLESKCWKPTYLTVLKIYSSNVSTYVLFSFVNIWNLFFVLCTGIT
jgi:hypothetical protein